MKMESVALVSAAVGKSNRSIAEIADILGISSSTLYGKLDPYPKPDRHYVLGLEEAIIICRFIGDTTLAEHIHSTFETDSSTPDGKDMDEECLQCFQALAALVAGIKARAPYTELIRLFAAACKELKDIIKRARAEQSAPNGKRAAA